MWELKIYNNKLYKFSWLENLNYVVSFQFLVIGKDRLLRRNTKRKSVYGREFYAILWCIWFLSLNYLLEFYVISMISQNLSKCHCISVYCIEMLPRCWNVYWYEDSWFCVVEMVHGVVTLQEGYAIITNDIQRIDW